MKDKPGSKIRIQVRNRDMMKRVRKAVWKEKDLDPICVYRKEKDGSTVEVKRKTLFRLHCELLPNEGIMIFSVSELLTEDNV